jgi:hypothetical protein
MRCFYHRIVVRGQLPRKGINFLTILYMFYLFTVACPFIILGVLILVWKPNLKSYRVFHNYVLRTLPYLYLYCLFLGLFELAGFTNTSWAFYSVIFFLVIGSLILLLIKWIFRL